MSLSLNWLSLLWETVAANKGLLSASEPSHKVFSPDDFAGFLNYLFYPAVIEMIKLGQ